MNKNLFIKKLIAFTIAEVLLTMAIIGVISAMLLRNLNRVDPDKDKFMFIKGYHALESIITSSLNDSFKYDQNIYSKIDLENWPEGMDKHFNLSHPPLPTAKFNIINNGKQETVCKEGCDHVLKQENAVCYYIAEHINTLGEIDCSNKTGSYNIRSSLGVCYSELTNWETVNGKKELNLIIDPSCKGNGYKVKIYQSGNITVPKPITGDKNQEKAYKWITNPTTLDDK